MLSPWSQGLRRATSKTVTSSEPLLTGDTPLLVGGIGTRRWLGWGKNGRWRIRLVGSVCFRWIHLWIYPQNKAKGNGTIFFCCCCCFFHPNLFLLLLPFLRFINKRIECIFFDSPTWAETRLVTWLNDLPWTREVTSTSSWGGVEKATDQWEYGFREKLNRTWPFSRETVVSFQDTAGRRYRFRRKRESEKARNRVYIFPHECQSNMTEPTCQWRLCLEVSTLI